MGIIAQISAARIARFREANSRSPVEYCGLDASTVTYRLSDGSAWVFPRSDARQLGNPRWAHLVETV